MSIIGTGQPTPVNLFSNDLGVQAAHKILRELRRDESLWTDSLGRALDRVLTIGLAGLDNHDATVWRFLDNATEMACIARRDRDSGRKPAGELLNSIDYPIYFNALKADGVIIANDAMSDPRTRDLLEKYLVPNNVHALLDATLYREGRLFGVLCFEHLHTARQWTEAERELVVSLADLIDQLLLNEELRRRNQMMRLLNGLALDLGQNNSVQDLARIALGRLQDQFGNVWAAFYQLEASGQYLEMLAIAAKGLSNEFIGSLRRIPLKGGLIGRAVQEERILAIPCVEGHPLVDAGSLRIAQEHGIKGAIGIPLMHAGKVLGGVTIWFSEIGWLDPDDLDAYDSIASTFSIAFANAMHVAQLQYRARHDAVTGLANRDQLLEDVSSHVDAPGPQLPLLLLLVDIKDFKQVNDALGRSNGDRLLEAVGKRIAIASLEQHGRAYRLAGAEYALLIPGEEARANALVLATNLQKAISQPLEIGSLQLIVNSQIGLAILPDHGAEGHALVRSADIALGWAKQGTDSVSLYDPTKDVSGPRNIELLGELRRAMDFDQLSLHYQPKIDLASGNLVSCEALLRWTHPRFGSIPPDRFIGVAEAGNLMPLLTLWVAKAAIAQIREFHLAGIGISVAINVSAHNMLDMDFPRQMEELLDRYGVNAVSLRLEITETVLMRDPDRAMMVIEQLANLGFALDIDDFGTGHSSLAYLRRLPLNALKIDRAFIRELPLHPQDEVIVRSTVGLGHGLGLKVVAEGVEDEATLDKLYELGCDEAQGYFISKPLPAVEFIAWTRHRAG